MISTAKAYSGSEKKNVELTHLQSFNFLKYEDTVDLA